MVDEYRLSIGIDASEATQGADTAKTALDQIGQKAESTVTKVDKLEVSLTKVVDAAGKVTVFKEVKRSLEDMEGAATKLTSATDMLKQKQEELGGSTDKIKAALQDTASATDKLRQVSADNTDSLKTLKDEAKGAGSSLRAAAESAGVFGKATESVTQSVKGMTVTLGDLLQAQEKTGDLGAKQFLDMAANVDTAKSSVSEFKDAAATAGRALQEVQPEARGWAEYSRDIAQTTISIDALKVAASGTGDVLADMQPSMADWSGYARGLESLEETVQGLGATAADTEQSLDEVVPTIVGWDDYTRALTATADTLGTVKDVAEDTSSTLESMLPDTAGWDDYARGMEVIASRNDEVSRSAAQAAQMIEDFFGPAVQSAANDMGILSDAMAVTLEASAENKVFFKAAGEEMATSFEAARAAIVEAEEATSGFSRTLSIMGEEFADAGKLMDSMRLMDLSDQFKALEIHIRDALAPGSELLRQFEESLGMARGEVYNLYKAFGTLMAEMTDVKLSFEQGTISAKEYGLYYAEIEGRISSLLPRLMDLRAALQSDESAGGALKEVTAITERLMGLFSSMKAGSDEGIEAILSFSSNLTRMAEEAAAAGDVLGASRLFDLADKFKELEDGLNASLAPGSQLLQQFADAANMTADEVQTLFQRYGDLLSGLAEAKAGFEAGKVTLEDYGNELVNASNAIKELTPELAALKSQLEKEGDGANEATDAVKKMIDELGGAQQSINEFSEGNKAASDAGQALNNTMTTLSATAGHLNRLFFRLIGIAGLGGAFFVASKEASAYSDQLVRLGNMADMTADEVAGLSKEMKDLADQFGNRRVEEATAALAIMSRGYTEAADAVKILTAANTLADATFGDMRSSAASLAQAMAAFEMGASEAEDAAATLAVASGGSAEAMQQMAFMAGRLGATMQQAGLDLEDFSVAVATLRKGGMETRRAIMGLTQLVATLTNQTTKSKLKFEELGISVDAQRIAYEGLGPVLQEIYEKTEGNKAALQRLLGSQQAATTLLAMMRNEGALYAKSMDDMANKTDRMREMAEEVNATFTKLSNNIKSSLLNKLADFGVSIKKTLLPLMESLYEHMEATAALMGTGFKVAAVLAGLDLVGKALVGVQAHFIKTALASEKLKIQAKTDADEVAIAVEVASQRAVMAVDKARTQIAVAMTKLGAAIVTGIIAIDLYKIIRDEMNKAIPGFKPLFDVVDTIGLYAKRGLVEFVANTLAGIKKAFLLITGIVTFTVSAIETVVGAAAQGIGGLLEKLPGQAERGAAMVQWGTKEIQRAADANAEWAQSWKKVDDELMEVYQTTDKVLAQESPFGQGKASEVDNYTNSLSSLNAMLLDVSATLSTLDKAPQLKNAFAGVSNTAFKLTAPGPLPLGQEMTPKVREFGRPSLSENQRQEIEGAISSDEIFGLRQRRAIIDKQIADIQASNMPAKEQEEAIAALTRQLAKLGVEADQLAQKRGVWEEYKRSILSAADPAQAALSTLEDRIKQLRHANAMGLSDEAMTRGIVAAQIAYVEAARATALYVNEVKTVTQAVDPAQAAMDAYADSAWLAVKALAAGADQEEINEFLRRQGVLLENNLEDLAKYGDRLKALELKYDPLVALEREHTEAIRELNNAMAESKLAEEERQAVYAKMKGIIDAEFEARQRLLELEQNGLVQLAAKYDPLIANELERQKALIEMEQLLAKATLTEQERIEWRIKAEQVINEQYDRQAREVRGQITLADAWKKAWESAIERIDGAFADLWKSMFDGMDSFKEALKDTAKQLIAEIAHAKITRPLIMKVGEIFSKTPKPGEVFGEKTGGIMDMLIGAGAGKTAFATDAKQPDWRRTIAEGAADGFKKVLPALSGAPTDGLGLGITPEGGFVVEDLLSGLEGIGGTIQADMSAALDDFSSMVMGKVQQQIMGGAGAGPEIAMGGGGSGGIINQVVNAMMAGKFGKTLMGMSTSLAAFGTAFKGGMATWMAGGGYSSMSQVALGAQSGVAGWGSMAGQAVGGAGMGMATGWATDQLVGSRGNAGRNMALSAAGGVIGSLWGPVGSLVGGAIGSLVDNIIGGGKEVKNFGYEISVVGGKVMGDFFTKVKEYGSWFSSSTKVKREDLDWWDPVLRLMQAAFKETRDMLLGFAEELGGSIEAISEFTAATLKINTKGKKPEQVEAEVGQAQIDLMGRQIQAYLGSMQGSTPESGDAKSIWDRLAQILSGSGPTKEVNESTNEIIPAQFRELLNTFLISGKDLIKMNPDLKKAGDVFKNSMHYTKEFVEAFKQLATLTVAMNMKPSVEGLDLYKKMNATLTEQYQELADAALEVAQNFDGTIEDITKVTAAFVAQREAAVKLAMALHEAEAQITSMFKNTADSIRESLMNPEQLYEYRRTKVDDLTAQLRNETDPGKMQEIANEINSLVNAMYSSLDESQRTAMAPEFIKYLEDISTIVKEQTSAALGNLDQSAEDMNSKVMQMMLGDMKDVTGQQAATTEAFGKSVDAFGQYVERFAAAFAGKGGQTTTAQPVGLSSGGTTAYRPVSGGGFSGFSGGREVNA